MPTDYYIRKLTLFSSISWWNLLAGVERQHPGDHKACDKTSGKERGSQKDFRAHLWRGVNFCDNFPIYEEVLVWEQFDFCKGNSPLTLIFAEHFPCGYFLGSLSFFRSEPCFVCSWRTWCATQWPTRSMQNGKPFSPLMLSTLSSGKVAPCMALAIEGQFKSFGLFWDSRWHHGRHPCHQGHVCSQTTRPLWLWLLRCCVLIQIFWSHTLGLNLVRFPNSQEGRGTWLV